MPSQLTSEEVERIAELAHLDIDARRSAAMFAQQLTAILDYAARIQERRDNGTCRHSPRQVPRSAWREDAPAGSLQRDEVVNKRAGRGEVGAGLFRVPKVL